MTMALFDAISIAGSGATVHRAWLDAVSDNLANMNNATATSGEAFRERFIQAQPVADGKGARVSGVLFGDGTGRLAYQPDHPLADQDGMVRYPDIDLSGQMTQMIMAQRGYQANLSVVDRAKDAYQAALQLGRG
jgi:flagellar basal-body rod protein FlgC